MAKAKTTTKPIRLPINVSEADKVFGGSVRKILPEWSEIPDEYDGRGVWTRWQQEWFYKGLTKYPVPREGIDLRQAMDNLACVQGSWAPKHEHKEAGVAWLASLWFSSPDGQPIKARETA